MVSTNYRTRGYFRLQAFRTRRLAWLCATNWPTVFPGVIEKFRDNAMSEALVRRSDDGPIVILTLDVTLTSSPPLLFSSSWKTRVEPH